MLCGRYGVAILALRMPYRRIPAEFGDAGGASVKRGMFAWWNLGLAVDGKGQRVRSLSFMLPPVQFMAKASLQPSMHAVVFPAHITLMW
jgi:hypothetical protein